MIALLVGVCAAPSSYGVVLLDDSYEDELFLHDPNGGEVPNLPDETIFWVGRTADGIEGNGAGAARILMNASSQKAWINFAPGNKASHLGVGDTLTARIDYIPRGASATTTSRNWRWGLYYDPTDPVVETHNNNVVGGPGALAPYTDVVGYSTFINMTGADADPNVVTTVQQTGKRTSQTTSSLLGSGGAHTLISGGSEFSHVGNNEYTLEMIVNRVSLSLVTFTTSIYDKTGGDVLLSTQTVNDDGSTFTGARNANFSFIGFRDSGTATSFAAFDFTRIYVEGPALVPEPTTLLLGALMAPLALLRRRR
jgi:hypothetical protein